MRNDHSKAASPIYNNTIGYNASLRDRAGDSALLKQRAMAVGAFPQAILLRGEVAAARLTYVFFHLFISVLLDGVGVGASSARPVRLVTFSFTSGGEDMRYVSPRGEINR